MGDRPSRHRLAQPAGRPKLGAMPWAVCWDELQAAKWMPWCPHKVVPGRLCLDVLRIFFSEYSWRDLAKPCAHHCTPLGSPSCLLRGFVSASINRVPGPCSSARAAAGDIARPRGKLCGGWIEGRGKDLPFRAKSCILRLRDTDVSCFWV